MATRLQSGKAGNQAIWTMPLTTRATIANQRPHSLPEKSARPREDQDDAPDDQAPAPGGEVGRHQKTGPGDQVDLVLQQRGQALDDVDGADGEQHRRCEDDPAGPRRAFVGIGGHDVRASRRLRPAGPPAARHQSINAGAGRHRPEGTNGRPPRSGGRRRRLAPICGSSRSARRCTCPRATWAPSTASSAAFVPSRRCRGIAGLIGSGREGGRSPALVDSIAAGAPATPA